LSPCSAALSLLALAAPSFPQGDTCDCHATNARYNIVNQPKTGYDFIPIVPDDSLGFYVAYSAKQNETNTDFVSTSCMYLLPLDKNEVLIFGGGFGDTWYLPGGAYFDADYDAGMLKEAIVGCMGRDPARTRVRFVAPHGHPDHVTVAFIKALERAGLEVVEIAYHEGDRDWIEGLPWSTHHPALFHVLPSADCSEELASYSSPLGRIAVVSRPGHTPGSIDLVLDVLGNPGDRVHVLGSSGGGCPAPPGVSMTLSAHGTAVIDGPRRAQVELLQGQGVNRMCFNSLTPPKLGTSWVTQIAIDPHPGATMVYVFGTDCGLDPGQLTPFGELLVNPLGLSQFSVARPVFSSDKEYVGMDIPRDPSLMGRTCYVQAAILGGGVELCNGMRIVIGF
jgi:hypothetical protein